MIYEHDAPLFTLSASDPTFADQLAPAAGIAGQSPIAAAGDGENITTAAAAAAAAGPLPVRHVEVLAEAGHGRWEV